MLELLIFNNPDHTALKCVGKGGKVLITEEYSDKVQYSKNIKLDTLLIPPSGKYIGVLRDRLTFDCEHGPERNKYKKQKTLDRQERDLQVLLCFFFNNA